MALLVACNADTDFPEGPVVNGDEPAPPARGGITDNPADGPGTYTGDHRPDDDGSLTCDAGESVCGGSCVDLRSDAFHCGGCSQACSGDRSCSDGICNVDTWATGFAGQYMAGTRDVAVGPKGEIVVVGSFDGKLEQATVSGASEGARDVFVAKLDAEGELMWLRRFGGQSNEEATEVAIDAKGRIAIAGHFDGELPIMADSLVSRGNDDIFVAILSGDDGAPLWAASYGDGGDAEAGSEQTSNPEAQHPTALAFDSNGELILAGVFSGNLAIGTDVLYGAGDQDTFVVKLGVDGTPRWLHSYADSDNQIINAVAVDSSDSVIVAGHFHNRMRLGSFTFNTPGEGDAFVGKIDTDGIVTWANDFGDAGDESVAALAVDPNSNAIVVAGHANTPYLMRFDTDGSHVEGAAVPTTAARIADISIAPSGNIWVAGSLNGVFNVDTSTMQSNGEDALVLLYNAELQLTWSHRYGSSGEDRAVAVSATEEGNAVVVGDFTAVFDNGSTPLAASGISNAFVSGLSL
jgi:hypothetical protein